MLRHLARCFAAALLFATALAPAAFSAEPSAPEPLAPPQGAEAPPPPPPQRQPMQKRPDLTFAATPAPTEFRGLPFGSRLPEGMAPAPAPLKNTYMRPDDPLHFGTAAIKSVAYYFPKGVFMGVGIAFEGEANYFLIKDQLIQQYGPGRQYGDRYGWTWANFFIELRSPLGKTGELRYTFAP